MKIYYHRTFTKAFLKLPQKLREKVKITINNFQNNPYDPKLDNHALHGKQKGQRSISVSGDLRIIFVEKDNYEVVELTNVGTHTQVYK